MRTRTITTLATLAAAAGLITAAIPSAQAEPTRIDGTTTSALTTPATTSASATALSTLRQQTIDRANNLLAAAVKYEDAAGTTRLSTQPSSTRNVLSFNGSNTNSNVFNDYNGQDWCGYFVARTWTGENTPAPASFPRIPALYLRSQAWRTDANTPYHRFSQTRLPQPGDALVWQNGDGAVGVDNGVATGHVGVVTAVDTTTKVVTSVEGNVAGDEINRRTYTWDADGPTLPDKHFMGHTSRE